MEILKRLRIPFRTKVVVEGREVDFIIGRYAIDIDGHAQDVSKNEMLIRSGYCPVHLRNNNVTPALEEWLNQIYGSKSRNRSIHPDLGTYKRRYH